MKHAHEKVGFLNFLRDHRNHYFMLQTRMIVESIWRPTRSSRFDVRRQCRPRFHRESVRKKESNYASGDHSETGVVRRIPAAFRLYFVKIDVPASETARRRFPPASSCGRTRSGTPLSSCCRNSDETSVKTLSTGNSPETRQVLASWNCHRKARLSIQRAGS